ncbi:MULTISPECIES: hypothetical protein [Nocardia]|uniref:Uncharacterized protein n=1 Tax=Nocardia iowensis TaxID=204891 RepID=A0ABX8RHF5_NOCIO|nr:hypothetical protein [Nocardia iowensis]QXN88384.1 hypothetical protein KV110_22555 [Nocardia iowensis]
MPAAQYLIDLAMHFECRPNPFPNGTGGGTAVLCPGCRVLAPVYDVGHFVRYTWGTVAAYDTIDRIVTVYYDAPEPTSDGFGTSGVLAYPVSLSTSLRNSGE